MDRLFLTASSADMADRMLATSDRLNNRLALLEQEIQFLKDSNRVTTSISSIALIGALFSTYLYALRYPDDSQLQFLLKFSVGLNIMTFYCALRRSYEKVTVLEQEKINIEANQAAIAEDLNDLCENKFYRSNSPIRQAA